MKRKVTAIATSLVLLSAIAMIGCARGKVVQDPTKPISPTLDEISVQLAHVAEGVRAITDAKRVLLREGKITKEQSHAITVRLQVLNRAAGELNTKAAEYDSFDATAKADLSRLFGLVQSGYSDLVANNTLPASKVLDAAFSIIGEALAILRPYFGGS